MGPASRPVAEDDFDEAEAQAELARIRAGRAQLNPSSAGVHALYALYGTSCQRADPVPSCQVSANLRHALCSGASRSANEKCATLSHRGSQFAPCYRRGPAEQQHQLHRPCNVSKHVALDLLQYKLKLVPCCRWEPAGWQGQLLWPLATQVNAGRRSHLELRWKADTWAAADGSQQGGKASFYGRPAGQVNVRTQGASSLAHKTSGTRASQAGRAGLSQQVSTPGHLSVCFRCRESDLELLSHLLAYPWGR